MSDEQEKDLNDILESLEITSESRKTLLVAVVIAKNGINPVQSISCAHGTPIGGYAYDVQSDVIQIPCIEAREIGRINQSFFIGMHNTGNWKVALPLPYKIVYRNLNASQQKNVKEMLAKHGDKNVELHFIQIHGCN